MSQEQLSSSSKKRNFITAEQKREICLLKRNKPQPKNVELAAKYRISQGQVSDILKESEKWLSTDPNSYQAKLKRTHTLPAAKIDEPLILWIEKALEYNLTITGSIIQEKALRFAELLEVTNFKASSGWLHNFKQRYSIKEYNKHGESQSAPIEEIPQMRIELRNILKDYRLEDIFNCDETGLFWKMEPSRGLSIGPISGIKKNKERVTVLLTCNSVGTEKLKPLFIHKFQTPKPLRGIDKSTLPVDYYWNSKAWMQLTIWNDYLKKLNDKMHLENRNILLLIDNAPTHNLTDNLELTNVKIHYLPPNTTAHLQPCDAGIIHSFKANYRKLLLKKKIKNHDIAQTGVDPKPIDIKKAIDYVAKAWKSVTPTTIFNCWKKTGIIPLSNGELSNEEIESSINVIKSISNDQNNEIENLINELSFSSPMAAGEYISIDDGAEDSEMVTEEEIIASFIPAEEEEETGESDTSASKTTISINDAAAAFETVHDFLQQGDIEIDYSESKVLKSLKRKLRLLKIKNQTQTRIDSFFK